MLFFLTLHTEKLVVEAQWTQRVIHTPTPSISSADSCSPVYVVKHTSHTFHTIFMRKICFHKENLLFSLSFQILKAIYPTLHMNPHMGKHLPHGFSQQSEQDHKKGPQVGLSVLVRWGSALECIEGYSIVCLYFAVTTCAVNLVGFYHVGHHVKPCVFEM